MRRRQVLAYLLVWALFAQVALAARHTSITLDEPLHITSGYACLLTGDYRLVEEHPPLLKMLQAAPLLLAQPALPDPRTVSGWESGQLIPAAQNVVVPYRPIESLVFAARVPTMLVAVLLAALVFRWTADLFGSWAGLLALVLFAFDPNILAHAGVAATDLGAACGIFASLYTFWRWLRKPTTGRALLAGLALGLALGVKLTAALLIPVQGVLLLLYAGSRIQIRDWKTWARFASIWLVGAFALWATYRFEVGTAPGVPFPVPAPSHLLPLLKLQEHMREGHSAFLMGENFHHGTWTYFPIAFALKTPPLTLALLLLAPLGLLLRRLKSAGWRDEIALLIFPVLYFGISLTSGINIGYRHLLPVLPFLFVGVARIADGKSQIPSDEMTDNESGFFHLPFPHFSFAILGIALVAYAATTLSLFPWHLAYFNIFAGGPDGGYRYLADSNLDWGQTWEALAHYIDDEEITEFGLSQYTINDPHAYGLDYDPLPPWPDAPPVLPRRFNPAPGVYAISTTTLQGVVVAEPEMFDYFRNLEPTARIGHAMFVYEVIDHPHATSAAQCTVPVAPLQPDVLVEGFGRDDLRIVAFDCSQSWLVPPGDGWYVLAGAYEGWARDQAQRGRLAYEQTRSTALPPFAVYEWFDLDALANATTSPVRVAPGDWLPQRAADEGAVLSPPIDLGGDLTFLGIVVEEDGTQADQRYVVQTAWRVNRSPVQTFSVMAHLLGADGIPIAVADGLGVPTDQLQPGDIFLQRHTFEIPPEAPPGTHWLQVGAYTLPDIVRLPVTHDGTVVGDRMIVDAVEVGQP
jgi:hypothetical protein